MTFMGSNIIQRSLFYATGEAKPDVLFFSQACRERLARKLIGLIFFIFSGLVDALGFRFS